MRCRLLMGVRFSGTRLYFGVAASLLFAFSPIATGAASGQQAPTPAMGATQDQRSLPDIPTLLRDVSKNQRQIEEIQKLYTCHLSEEEDKVDSNGQVKSRTMKDYDVFYVGDEQVLHLLAKDGKLLQGSEKRDADDNFNKRYDKLKKQQAELASDPKKQAKREEEEEAELSDFLRAERFTNPRREMFRGHEVIAFDVSGNPNYKPKKAIDRIIQKLSGFMRVDEQAREIVRLEARFAESAKIGGGVLASVQQGSNFVFEQERVNDEIWLPSYIEAHVAARVLIVKLKQNFIDRYSDYKKFQVGATIKARVN